jgi:hypothetical protein
MINQLLPVITFLIIGYLLGRLIAWLRFRNIYLKLNAEIIRLDEQKRKLCPAYRNNLIGFDACKAPECGGSQLCLFARGVPHP